MLLRWVVIIASVSVAACEARPEVEDTAAMHEVAPGPEVADRAASAPTSTEHHREPAVSGPEVDPGAAAVAAAVREITIPVGTELSLNLRSSVSSKDSSMEDPVEATLRQPVVIDGKTVIPAGAVVSGHVTEATRPGRVKGVARVGMRFTSLHIGDTRYGIRTAAVSRQARTTKKEDATKIGVGAGAGAITGAIAGGKKGAAIGTAVGAGGGTAVVLATRGEEVTLARGTVVTTRLTQPLTIRIH